MRIIGVDPGKEGAIAHIDQKPDERTIGIANMPKTVGDLIDLFRELRRYDGHVSCWLEFVRASPQMGVTSAFTFGRGFGHLEAVIPAMGIPCQQITPSKWQAKIGKKFKGDKDQLRAEAQRLYPELTKLTKRAADALLIAHVGWLREVEQDTLRRKAADDRRPQRPPIPAGSVG